MRPVSGTGNPSAGHAGADNLSQNATVQPMTYMMATEDAIDAEDDAGFLAQRYPPKHGFDSALRSGKGQRRQSSVSASTSVSSWPSPFLPSQKGLETPHDLSRPTTPVLVGSTGPESVISSTTSSPISSLAASISPSRNSSALSLIHPHHGGGGFQHLMDGIPGSHTPQLIMPSLTVPRRRPFSDTGKSLGKLKVLVAGQAGIGKSSLIGSIGQCCEHIVHMDPVTASPRGKVAEIYASTRPYPWWRADLDPSLSARRRRSSTADEILDRNMCFVDCPTRQKSEVAHPAIRYIESQLLPLLHRPINDADLWHLLSGGAESIVDVVLYLLPHTGPEPADAETMKALQGITNVIPLMARADELDNEEANTSKQQIQRRLANEDVEYFSFAAPGSQQAASDIYAVSSVSESDHDVMDASILMSSEYARPLVSTDLSRLLEHLMSPDGSARLRHAASLKCVRWRRQQGSGLSLSLQSALSRRHPAEAYSLTPAIPGNAFLHQQYWRPIEMASWAESLRQSLTAERLGELPLQRLEPGAVVCEMPVARIDQHRRRQRHGRSRRQERISHHQDPLGLLGLAGQIKCNSRLTLELVSSVGVLGYVTSWLVRPDGQVGLIPRWC